MVAAMRENGARPGILRQPRAGARSRRPGQGATRQTATVQAPRRPAAWLNWILILAGAGVVVAAALQAYLKLEAIPVQQITVTGELEHTQTEAVQEMVQPALVGGFLNADLRRIQQQLEELPWIYRASVQRRWPNALEIHVVEQLPIARWGEHGFLNHEGEVFNSRSANEGPALPLLRGPEGTARSLMVRYQRIIEILAPLHLAVEQLAVDERGQLEVVLQGGVRVMIGSDDFLERMHRFVAIYRAELASRYARVERVDLRYEQGVAVTYTETGAEADADSSRVAGI
jgi:cell division protein FtsQ